MWDAVRTGWSKPSSDFPNYYTAARLTLENQPLAEFYNWTWFQRQITRSGFGLQLGGYIPQTPLTMLPFIPLSRAAPLTARRIWLILNLLFLTGSVYLMARMTRMSPQVVWLVTFLSYPALRSNLLLGQYYLFLLALFTLCVFFLRGRWEAVGGAIAGSAAVLKLYGLPLLLFFATSRRTRAALAMLAMVLAGWLGSIALFGWHDTEYFLRVILPRAFKGETLDPYNPSNGSAAVLLRRLMIAEPELNPHPLLDAPRLYAFVWTGFVLLVTAIPALSAVHSLKRSFAWWMTAMLLVSPNTASYTFALLPLPAALLISELPLMECIAVIAIDVLIGLPLWNHWRLLYPRFWLLLLAFLLIGWKERMRIPKRRAIAASLAILVASFGMALAEQHRDPPGDLAILERGAIYSGAPGTSHGKILYESIDGEHYGLKVFSRGFIRPLRFEGHTFRPSMPDSGEVAFFELVDGTGPKLMELDLFTNEPRRIFAGVRNFQDFAISHRGGILAVASGNDLYAVEKGESRRIGSFDSPRDLSFAPGDRSLIYVAGPENAARIDEFDLSTKKAVTIRRTEGSVARPSRSADRSFLVYASRRAGENWKIVVVRVADGRTRTIESPGCNCYDPAWNTDSDEIIYATDCRRGVFLPRLMEVRAGLLFAR